MTASAKPPRQAPDSTIPDKFKCPITNAIMVDPVIADDGMIYEYQAIKEWFNKQQSFNRPLRSPWTRGLINHTLREDEDLRQEIQEWIKEHKITEVERSCTTEHNCN